MTRRRSSSRRKKHRGFSLPQIELSSDQVLDIVGYGLLAIAVLTLLSFLSANHGLIPTWWLGMLRQAFGWGAYATPLLLGALGLWLVLRDFSDQLPQVAVEQVIGTLVGYLALLVTMHLLAALIIYGGNLVATARAGDGGGWTGGTIARLLLQGLGSVGLVVAMVTWWLIVVLLTLKVTMKDVVDALQPVTQHLRLPRIPQRRRSIEPTALTDFGGDAVQRATGQPNRQPVRAPIRITPAKQHEPAPPAVPDFAHLIGDNEPWQVPAMAEILEPGIDIDINAEILRQQARLIEDTLANLGAPARVMEINPGPVVTQFCIEPGVSISNSGREAKVKVSRITGAANDLALALEARTLRIEAPIPGKGLIGIEVPNPEVSLVALRDVMETEEFTGLDAPLRLALGRDVSGNPVVTDLASMPHLLIAGTTGSGKSVCINAIVAALLLQSTPNELRLLMVDPKRVELIGYAGIPHLLSKVVVEMERVSSALQWLLREMENRYRLFSEARATNILDYNERVAPALGEKRLPYIVVIVDELADMMMVAPQETERSICRIAQMARATGIHLVLATQRPSVDVVTGLIKANFPARIAFNVASAVDSRVILDLPGAEQLLGQGDMLFLSADSGTPIRLQGAFVSDEELRRLVNYWKQQGRPEAAPTAAKPIQQPLWEELQVREEQKIEFEDELLPDVIDVVLTEQRASISLLQRKLRIGYTRAARIMDILERNGVVGPQPSGGQAREVFPGAARALLNPQAQEQ